MGKMSRRIACALALTFLWSPAMTAVPASSPFRLPLTARVTERSPDGKGWLEQGWMPVTLVSAQGQFKAALSQGGWRFIYAIPIGGSSRSLYVWRRGGREVTLMLWRMDTSRTGFSWGLADVDAERKVGRNHRKGV